MTTTKTRKRGKHLPLVKHAPYGVFAAMGRKLGTAASAITNVNQGKSTSARITSELLSFQRNPGWWMTQNKRYFAERSKAA